MSDKYYAVDNTYIKDDKDYRVEAYRDNDSGVYGGRFGYL